MLNQVYDITLIPKKESELSRIVLQFTGLTREEAITRAKIMYPDYEILRVFPWNPYLMKEEKG